MLPSGRERSSPEGEKFGSKALASGGRDGLAPPKLIGGRRIQPLNLVVCPSCGRESNQPGAAYCLYCGSSLTQAQGPASQGMAPAPSYGATGTVPTTSERYQRALGGVERLATIVAVLSVIALILVLI